LGIAESITDATTTVPIVGELTMGFHLCEEDDDGTGIMDASFIVSLVKCYQQVIMDLIDVDESSSELICVVLEAEPELSVDEATIRIRIQFPYCQVGLDFYRRRFRPKIEQLLRGKNVISKLRIQPTGDWSSIIKDYNTIFPMYGSTTSATDNKVRITHIYNNIIEEEDSDDEIVEMELHEAYQPDKHQYVMRGFIPTDLLTAVEDEVEDLHTFWLPLFLSFTYWGKLAKPRLSEAVQKAPANGFRDDVTSSDPKIIAGYMLPLLKEHRIKQEFYWIDVGRALYNIHDGTTEGLDRWIEFSKRLPMEGRTAKDCRMKYETLRDTGLSVKTLAWYAREDSPDLYREWHQHWIAPILHNVLLSITNADVAAAVYRMFWLDYIYDSQMDKWWRFQGHSLRRLERAIGLRKDINTVLVAEFDRLRHKLTGTNTTGMNSHDLHEREEFIKACSKVIQKLKTDSFISSVLRSCQAVGSADNISSGFDVPDFNRRIDSDPNKTGWVNCIIECCGDEACVRQGKPEDYITKVSPIGYRRDYHWNHPIVLEVLDFLKKVFVDNDLRHHVCKRIASILKGRNGEKLFDILSGAGDNAKSIFVALLKAVLGTYAIDFPVSMLTGAKGNAGSASPELAQARGAHAAFVSEPDSGDEMKAGPIKRFTGNDSFFCRMLFDNGGSIESFIKLFYMCNRIPNIPNADKAVKARLWICPFLSTFCKDPQSPDNPDGYPLSEEEQYRQLKFKANPDFHKRIPDLAYGMLWIMVQYFPKYSVEGLTPVPRVVAEVTEQHWRDNDPYIQFIQEKISYAYVVDTATGKRMTDDEGNEVHDDKKTLSATHIFPVFNQWWRLYYPGSSVPDVRVLKAEMSAKDRLGAQTKRQQWVGVILKDQAAQVADGGALQTYSGGGGGVASGAGVGGGGGILSKASAMIPMGMPKPSGLAAGLSSLGLVRTQEMPLLI
jgi:hypothetical protein